MRLNLYDRVYGLMVESMISSYFTPIQPIEPSIVIFFKLLLFWIREYFLCDVSFSDPNKYLPESRYLLHREAQLALKMFLVNDCIFSKCFMTGHDSERNIYYLKIFCLTKDFNLEAVETMLIFSQKLEK